MRYLPILLLASVAQAQTSCPKISDNKAHVCWGAVTAYTDGSSVASGTVVTYTVQRQSGATWANETATTATDWISAVLTPGTYTYRVTATIAGMTSVPSNTASRDSVNPTPNAPVIIIAATIHANGPPTYRIIQSVKLKSDEVVFVAPESMRKLFASK